MTAAPLCARRVLIARPQGKGAELAAQVEALGGRAQIISTLHIEPLNNPAPEGPFDLLIAVSANALHCGLAAQVHRWSAPLLAVGPATARAARQAGFAPVITPEHTYNSEALLALPALVEISGRRLLLARGEAGRPLLAQTLCQRGARLTQWALYRRCDALCQSQLRSVLQAGVDMLSASSDAVLSALLAALPHCDRAQVLACPLAVNSQRGAAFARSQGWLGPIEAASSAGDAGQLSALCRLSAQTADRCAAHQKGQ